MLLSGAASSIREQVNATCAFCTHSANLADLAPMQVDLAWTGAAQDAARVVAGIGIS
jgi:hypothetical protein